jgi:DNA-binding transcriptional ArsR family regulator
MIDLEVIHDAATAASALDPIRSRLLAELSEPASAAALAARIGLGRQKINYHLRTLEAHGLVAVAQEKRWGGLVERRYVASAASYVVSPDVLGPLAADPTRNSDRLSASYLVALAARTVREVGELWRTARRAQKRLATLSLDTTIRFASPEARADFTEELTRSITALVARYDDGSAPDGRPYRLILSAYPLPTSPHPQEDSSCP